MYKKSFVNGGRVEIEDGMALACAVVGEEGADVVLHGEHEDVLRGLCLMTIKALSKCRSAERFAFVARLREMIIDEKLLEDGFEWKLYLKGTEVPVKLEEATAVLIGRLLKDFIEDIKKDR